MAPDQSFPEQMPTVADREALYRFFSNPKVIVEGLLEGHLRQTHDRQRGSGRGSHPGRTLSLPQHAGKSCALGRSAQVRGWKHLLMHHIDDVHASGGRSIANKVSAAAIALQTVALGGILSEMRKTLEALDPLAQVVHVDGAHVRSKQPVGVLDNFRERLEGFGRE
ncbi:MAG: hypothetical protein JWN04_226 [Myxococcaceae bacterium]|nr:hypothetical protein [Myxococcaceae bacterium]